MLIERGAHLAQRPPNEKRYYVRGLPRLTREQREIITNQGMHKRHPGHRPGMFAIRGDLAIYRASRDELRLMRRRSPGRRFHKRGNVIRAQLTAEQLEHLRRRRRSEPRGPTRIGSLMRML